MILRRDPTYPSARALLGDYAVRQNREDRSQPLLNEVMDNTFRPVHEAWVVLWKAQQQAERALNEARARRYVAIQGLNDALRQLSRALETSSAVGGEAVAVLRRYLPGGNLDVLYHPAALQIVALEPHLRAIADASEQVIPASIRAGFLLSFAAARDAQEQVEIAEWNAAAAERARIDSDDRWIGAFNAFHRAVEYVAFKARGDTSDWIRYWVVSAATPLPAESGAGSRHTVQAHERP